MIALRYVPLVFSTVALLACVSPQVAEAVVVCPRVLSEHTADTTDLLRFRQFSRWRDKTGNDLAIAVWQYLCGYETGLYHFYEVLDGNDPFDEYATVRDPLKILNVYNMGYCGIFGPVLDGIFQGVGFEQGRSFGLQNWNHCATEVWYDDGWHYLDLDVRGALLDDTGIVASLEQAQDDRTLWVSPRRRVEPFFPKDPDKGRVFDIYCGSPVHFQYRWFQGSHTMDFYLRQGESFTRWWAPQGGRWHHLSRYSETKWVRDLILEQPIGMKPNHREFTRWNHGNGLFHYAPNLSAGSTDFQDGVFAVRNLAPDERGLHLVDTGDAETIFEVFTPYIIVAKINDIGDPNDDAGASVLTLETALPVDVEVSLDHGLTWREARTIQSGAKKAVDLTPFVKGTCGYLLRLSTSGAEKQAAIQSLAIDTWVQVAPISLPRLKAGENRMKYEIGDRYGWRTVPMLVHPETSDLQDLARHLIAMPADYHPRRNTSRIRGDAIVRLTAPAGMKIAWFSVGATFRTHQGEQAKQTDNRIAYAVGEPRDFREIYRSSVPTWANHWRYNWDQDVQLDEPAETVYVKFHGNPGLNVMRACLHLLPKTMPQTNVEIIHSYEIGGRTYQETVDLAQPAGYIVRCDGEPNDIAVTVRVPSDEK